jgi:hypothetical protein
MGVWDAFGEPENDGGNFVNLDDEGDEFTGKLVAVEEHVTPKGTFPGQKEDTVSPKLILEAEDGEEYTLTAFRSVLKNELLELRPRIGDTLYFKNLGKPRNKNYYNYKVKVVSEAPKRGQRDDNEEF